MFTFLNLGRLGRYGNQKFQIAGTIGIALKHGEPFAFPLWWNHDAEKPPEGATFQPTTDLKELNVQQWFQNKLPELNLPPELFIRNEVPWGYNEIVLPPGNWDIWGHLQSEKYFLHAKEVIRHYFQFSDETMQQVNRLVDTTAVSTCCVQFRRGDYVDKAGYHPPIGRSFYEKALAEIPSNCQLLVFPEKNEAEAREIIGTSFRAQYIDNLPTVLKDAIASTCQHFIIPNSTYFWMSAWLGSYPDKKVITVTADDWFGPEAKSEAQPVLANDIIPADWIQIKA